MLIAAPSRSSAAMVRPRGSGRRRHRRGWAGRPAGCPTEMPRSCSAMITALATLSVPVTRTRSPAIDAECTSGSARRTARSNGVDGRKLIRWSACTLAARPSGVSAAMTRPWSMTTTRSQSRSASSMKCETNSKVTPAAAQVLQQVPHLAAGDRVQAGGELVQDRHLRVADQRERDRQPLLLPAGELREVGLALLDETQALEQLTGIVRLGVEAGVQVEGLDDAHLVRQPGLLQLDADHLPERGLLLGRVHAGDADAAAVALAQPTDALDRRRLPRPVGPQNAEDLPRLHREAHTVHHACARRRPSKVGHLDHGHERNSPATGAKPGDGSPERPELDDALRQPARLRRGEIPARGLAPDVPGVTDDHRMTVRRREPASAARPVRKTFSDRSLAPGAACPVLSVEPDGLAVRGKGGRPPEAESTRRECRCHRPGGARCSACRWCVSRRRERTARHRLAGVKAARIDTTS